MSKFRLKELRMTNLLSHKDTKIEFSDQDNLILIHGRDLDKMTYAGAGKSCVENAITFSLFGKAFRGQTSGSINNEKLISNWAKDTKEPLKIGLVLESESGVVEIQREMVYGVPTGTRTKLLVNGEVPKTFTTPQAPAKYLIDKILQMDYKTFSKMHSFRTGNQVQFFSLRGMDQLDTLEKFVSKVNFSEMSKLISEDMANLRNKIEVYKKDIEFCDTQIDTLKTHKSDYIDAQKKKLQKSLSVTEEKIKSIEEQLKETRVDLKKIDIGQEKIDTITSVLRNMKKEMDEQGNTIKIKKKTIITIRKLLKNDQCPTCYQGLNRDALETIISENQDDMKKSAQKILSIKDEYLTRKKKYDKIKDKLEKLKKRERELLKRTTKYNTQLKFHRREVETCKYELDNLDTSTPEYYEENLEEMKKKRTVAKRNKTRTERKLIKMKICFDSLKKKSPLKQYILKPLMPIFSNLMNKYFPTLWGTDIKGEVVISDNNNVEFKIHDGKSADEYESASSGECRIIDIAALLSFIEFAGILNRTTLGFMVIDEILESLDKILAIKVVNLLKDFAVRRNIQILFITNNSIIIDGQEKYGTFDREIIFQKQNGITKLIENREEVIEFDEIK